MQEEPRPKAPRSLEERRIHAERVSEVAFDSVERTNKDLAEKTARLRALRLASQIQADQPS